MDKRIIKMGFYLFDELYKVNGQRCEIEVN
jgi:hypothetical protein